jgi:hypothetical protein
MAEEFLDSRHEYACYASVHVTDLEPLDAT